jgi:hypothetical protein
MNGTFRGLVPRPAAIGYVAKGRIAAVTNVIFGGYQKASAVPMNRPGMSGDVVDKLVG